MSFRRFFVVRLGWALLALLIAVSVVFLCFHVFLEVPRDLDPGAQRLVNRYLRRGDPVYERYVRYVWDVARNGSPGRSLDGRQDSRTLALEAAPATGAVVLPGLALAIAMAGAFAVPWSRAGPRLRRLWRLPVYLAVGAMPVWVGLLLSFYLGFKWNWLPGANYCDFFNPAHDCGGAADWSKHLVLPWLTFALFFGAVYGRVLWYLLIKVRRGKEEERRRRRRGALLGFARIVGRDVGFAIGAAAFVEEIFFIPGLGWYFLYGIQAFDLPVAEAALLYATLFAVGIHFLVDVIVGALDADARAAWPVRVPPGPPRSARPELRKP